ncbi:MAG: hypothetical protein ACTHLO_14640 [Pseudolabrys sp.]
MNRLKDHLCFAVRFVGFGYVVLWPVSTPAGGDLFGASLLCRAGGAGALDVVCNMPHPLQLGIGLHAVGALCAALAVCDLLLRGVLRARGRRNAAAIAPAEPVQAPPAAAFVPQVRPRRRPMPPPRKLTEARTHFGLRGVPR